MARRCSDDIDPKRLDVVQQPRKRRVRAKPPAPEQLKAGRSAALARASKRPLSPGVMLEPAGVDGYVYTSPHADLELWDLQLADALGTRSQSVMQTFVRQLKGLVSETWDDAANRWKPNETELNAALAFVSSLRPRNEAEAALAAQMVAVHWMQMKMTKQALKYGDINGTDAGIAGKLARTYVMQIEALAKLRGKGSKSSQTIKVSRENHIHYHDHRGAEKSDGQAHDPNASPVIDSASLPGEESRGQVVRLPSRKRSAGV